MLKITLNLTIKIVNVKIPEKKIYIITECKYFFFLLYTQGANRSEGARMFTIINDCKETIWPAVTPGDQFEGGGFVLKPGQSMVFTAPVGWSGRIWGRTGCSFNQEGNGTCQTASCGSTLKCGASGKPPATLAEFTLASLDFYDVSLVDGYNLPVVVTPVNGNSKGGGNCSSAGCDGDLRQNCPNELAVKVCLRCKKINYVCLTTHHATLHEHYRLMY